jgi:hypothetical protein
MATQAQLDTLRQELKAVVLDAIDRVLERHAALTIAGEVLVEHEGLAFDEWSYRWPSGGSEDFTNCHWYRVTGSSGSSRVLVGRTEREVWSEMRDRIIVFGQMGKESSKTFYPWTEFVKTKDGSFAAIIPNPERPRAPLREDDPLPSRFTNRRVERTDQLFHSVIGEPSLRVVVDETEIESMVEHGYWVAELRGRL